VVISSTYWGGWREEDIINKDEEMIASLVDNGYRVLYTMSGVGKNCREGSKSEPAEVPVLH